MKREKRGRGREEQRGSKEDGCRKGKMMIRWIWQWQRKVGRVWRDEHGKTWKKERQRRARREC